jgi:hypothetical protein
MKKIFLLLPIFVVIAFAASQEPQESLIETSKDEEIYNLKARIADLEKENRILREDLKNETADQSLVIHERNLARKAYREHYLPLYQKMLGEGIALPKAEEIESFMDVYMPMAEIMAALTGEPR